MSPIKRILMLTAVIAISITSPALAQKKKEAAGIGFALANRFWAPTDSRIDGGSSVIRIHFQGPEDQYFFQEKEDATITFRNSGTGSLMVSGNISSQGIGFGMLLNDALRFEMMAGRASTYVNNGVLMSSDSIFNLGFFYTYRQTSGAFLDVGILYRHHRLNNTLPGNVVDQSGTSSPEVLDDMGGTMFNLGLGYGF